MMRERHRSPARSPHLACLIASVTLLAPAGCSVGDPGASAQSAGEPPTGDGDGNSTRGERRDPATDSPDGSGGLGDGGAQVEHSDLFDGGVWLPVRPLPPRPEPDQPPSDPPRDPCGPGTPSRVWSFDTSTEGWTVSADAAHAFLQWTGARVLQVDVVPDGNRVWTVEVELLEDFGDLSGEHLAAYILIEDPDVRAGVFVQSLGGISDDYWANGDWMIPPEGSWVCLDLAVDAPVFSGADYEPTRVTRLGVNFEGVGPARAFVGMVRY
jgi:hypothetical protein